MSCRFAFYSFASRLTVQKNRERYYLVKNCLFYVPHFLGTVNRFCNSFFFFFFHSVAAVAANCFWWSCSNTARVIACSANYSPIPHTTHTLFYVLFVFAASSSVCSVPPHIQNVCVVIIGSPSVIDLIIPPHKCICVQEGDLLAAVTFVKWRERDSIRISYQKCSIQCNTAAAVCCTRSQKRKRSAFVFFKKVTTHRHFFL